MSQRIFIIDRRKTRESFRLHHNHQPWHSTLAGFAWLDSESSLPAVDGGRSMALSGSLVSTEALAGSVCCLSVSVCPSIVVDL